MSRCKRRFGGSRTARSADQPSKRNRSEPSFTENATVASDAGSGDEASGPRVHVPKTKYAIAFGYLGTAYHGFQIQSTPDEAQVDTVEGRMLEALFAAGAIHESHRNVMAKLQLSKASRTDKGVHAACTYIGGRFELSHLSSGEPDVSREVALTAKLNDILPQDIRCFQILRVTRGFCARAMCSKRKYEYVLPTWLLRRRYVLDSAFKQERFAQLSDQMASHLETSDHVSCVRYGRSDGYDGTTEEREADLQLLESILGSYCGSHDFKNFTPRQKGMEHTTQRFIHEVKVERRELPDGDAVSVVITGQSFLYNQIRKMLSLAYEVYLGTAPTHAIKFALSRRHAVQTAIAPAEGLFLHHPYFEAYNRRCTPPQTPFIEYDDVEPLVEEFKRCRVYPEIARTFTSDVWHTWLDRIVRNPFFLENSDFCVVGDAPTVGGGAGAPPPAAAPDQAPSSSD